MDRTRRIARRAPKWDRKAKKTLVIVYQTLHSSQRKQIRLDTSPVKAIQLLKELYSQATEHDLIMLKQRFTTLQPIGEGVIGFMVDIKNIAAQLNEIGVAKNKMSVVLTAHSKLASYPVDHPFEEACRDFKSLL